MTNNYHSALPDDYELTADNWNAAPSALDSVLTNFKAGAQAASGLLIGGGTLDSASAIGGTSTTQGHLFPNMTTIERNAIASPATGLIIYNTTTGTLDQYDGTSWKSLSTTTIDEQIELIDEDDLTNTSQVDIASIPQTYLDLELRMYARNYVSASSGIILVRINDVTSSIYGNQIEYWSGSSTRNTSGSAVQTGIYVSPVVGATEDSGWRTAAVIKFFNYASSRDNHGGNYFVARRSESGVNQYYHSQAAWGMQNASALAINKLSILGRNSINTTTHNLDLFYQLYGRGRVA